MNYMTNSAWMNGSFCKVQDLNLNITELGVIHADATYDVIAIRNNKPFMLDAHIDRFLNSCKYWRLEFKWGREQIIEAIKGVHHFSGWNDSIIWISATRGATINGNPRNLAGCNVNVMIYAKPYQKFNGTGEATVCIANTVRRVPDWAIDQKHKNFVWPDLTRAQWEALDRGYDTAILQSVDGYITEGPGFNVAFVQDGNVYAPKNNVLPGITMRAVELACIELNINFSFMDIRGDDLEDVIDDMFLTTTVGNIATVTNFNGRQLIQSPIQKKLLLYFEGDR